MDIWDKNKRSEVMALVRGKNTKPEVIVRKYLFSQGFRYRVNVKTLPGKPDIVLPKYNAVIFVHGCFWHGHQIKGVYHRRFPVSNAEFWRNKIKNNSNRDIQNQEQLKEIGWRVFVIWECELSSKEKRENAFNNLVGILKKT
ncbi:DNA mismatch endonuclease (patch repair protein) [Dysgonomonas sp. PH5-45]|uniref:very short patch repair endonuclease n=1 Tax=unclassified Dysgonomonas TaxID=2630389 RepID=UPI0024764105|nr:MULTISPECIES: DNA mismatch endonuclease Vsr [unclassified Dysgonomonas]MDH6353742.1 DNA mismatch endonuclease (patch repair protein) [Dysgonomonas sp. PH5-45]MDH6386645.1 DNA mismatch endonuclease (patch repair protein) [Dysgonomonas sp. PH5-37]